MLCFRFYLQDFKEHLEMSTNSIKLELDKLFEDFFQGINLLETIDIDLIINQIRDIISKQSDITRTETEYAIEMSRLLLLKKLDNSVIQNKFKESSKKFSQTQSKKSVNRSKKK